MRRYSLRDDQWDRIKDILPGREGHVGGTAADNRLFVEAVLFRFRAGVPWRDLPERFGDWKIVYQRFNRWAKSGVFERVFKLLANDHDNEYMMIDATIVRAHQHSAGAQKRGRASHRPIPRRIDHQNSRGRRCPRQSRRGDAQPGPGSRSDLRPSSHRSPRSRRSDRRQGVRRRLLHRRSQCSSDHPSHPTQIQPKNPAPVRFLLYCERNLIERFFNKLKQFRAIATRYDKLDKIFLAGVQLACAVILLN